MGYFQFVAKWEGNYVYYQKILNVSIGTKEEEAEKQTYVILFKVLETTHTSKQ